MVCTKIIKKYTHKLSKTSKYSYYVILPKELAKKYGWKEKQKLEIVDKGMGRIEIKDWRRRYKNLLILKKYVNLVF